MRHNPRGERRIAKPASSLRDKITLCVVGERDAGAAKHIPDDTGRHSNVRRDLDDGVSMREIVVQNLHAPALSLRTMTITVGSLNEACAAPTASATCSIFLLSGHPS